jgi:hypothetical protein
MMRTLGAAAFVVLALAGLAAAQEPVKSFDQLNTRLRVGDTIYVTDAQGFERSGKILDLSAASLTFDDGGPRTVAGSEVRVVKERERDSLKNGALIGLAVGAGIGSTFAALICSGDGCDAGGVLLGVGLYGAIGAGIGTGIDAAIPGRKRVVYRAAGAMSAPRVSLAPVVTPRRKGLALSISF